jgi:hypothetical protein
MKTILAISNSGARGKSTTVLELARLLLSNFQSHIIIEASKNPNPQSLLNFIATKKTIAKNKPFDT